jgi:hypothetical protein
MGGFMELAEYEKKYPKYCKTCKGWGFFKSPDPGIKECDDCVRKELCPRCGQKIGVMYKCESCGWNVADRDRGLPGSKAW